VSDDETAANELIDEPAGRRDGAPELVAELLDGARSAVVEQHQRGDLRHRWVVAAERLDRAEHSFAHHAAPEDAQAFEQLCLHDRDICKIASICQGAGVTRHHRLAAQGSSRLPGVRARLARNGSARRRSA
jgi:hypothetical protein